MPFISHRAFNWRPVVIDETWGLNSIKKGNAYSLCNSLFCKRCGFLFLDIRFSDDELSRLYENYRAKNIQSYETYMNQAMLKKIKI